MKTIFITTQAEAMRLSHGIFTMRMCMCMMKVSFYGKG